MNTVLSLVLVVSSVMGGAVQKSTSPEPMSINEIQTELHQAIEQHEEKTLRKMLEALSHFNDDPKWGAVSYYYQAYIHYRLGTMFEEEIEEEQDELVEQAVTWLKTGLRKSDDKYKADMYALLSSCYGILIGGPFSAMSYGPKAQEAMEKAKKYGPDNPRVHMLDGIGKMYTPAMFGGGEVKAMNLFEKAERLYKQERQGELPIIAWGYSEIYVWIGKLHEQRDEFNEAKQAYQEALALNPDYKWVREKLLPDINEKLKS